RRAGDRRNMFRPFPAGFVSRAPDRHPADPDDFEPAFLKHAGLVRLLESLQNYFKHSFPFSPFLECMRGQVAPRYSTAFVIRFGRPASQIVAGSARTKSAVQFVSHARLSYENACSQWA